MARVTDERVLTTVERYFKRPEIESNLELLSQRLPPEARLLIAGGAIRNLVIELVHGSAPPTTDIDLFLGELPSNFKLSAALIDLETRPTDLGGLRWQPEASPYAYDLCRLADFIIIQNYHQLPTLEALLSGIDLSINAIVYDYRQRALYEHGCLAAIDDRIIDFNSRLIPDKCLIAYRLLLMAHKTGFRYSETAFQFLTRQMNVDTLVDTRRLLRVKQGKTLATSIMQALDQLCRCSTHADYLNAIEK